jgi:hypothetical protein
MEELHTDSIDGGHEASYGLGHVPGRGRTPTEMLRKEVLYQKDNKSISITRHISLTERVGDC